MYYKHSTCQSLIVVYDNYFWVSTKLRKQFHFSTESYQIMPGTWLTNDKILRTYCNFIQSYVPIWNWWLHNLLIACICMIPFFKSKSVWVITVFRVFLHFAALKWCIVPQFNFCMKNVPIYGSNQKNCFILLENHIN